MNCKVKITFFSIAMSVIFGNILIILYAFFRKKSILVDICSLSGIVLLYLFCAFRMIVPVEFPWVVVIPEKHLYNYFYSVINCDTGIMSLKVCHVLVALWIIGAIIGLIKLTIKYQKYGKIFDDISVNGVIVDNNQFGIKESSIKVIKTSIIPVPVSFGIKNRRILIPLNVYSQQEEKLIVAHEYMHIKNCDLIVQLLINILCALYWWNPFVYLLRADLGQYFELRCDSNVTEKMTDNQLIEYLEVLLKAYKLSGEEKFAKVSLGFMGIRGRNNYEIKERFIFLSQGKNKTHKKIGKTIAFIIAMVLTFLSYSFIIQPCFDAPQDDIGKNKDVNYEVTYENSYLIELNDGTYIFCTNNGFKDYISAEMAIELINQGYSLKVINGGN